MTPMIWETGCGAFRLYAIEDGWFFTAPGDMFPDSDPMVWEKQAHYLTPEGMLRISLGCFLVAGPDVLVMVDSGMGTVPAGMLPPGAEAGLMPQALASLGLDPAKVTAVVHTHLHLDHWGGDLTREGAAFFPNASVYVHRRELTYWLETAASPTASMVRARFRPFVEQGRVVPLDADSEVAPGVTATETFGHTPGHLSVVIASRGERTFILGDVAHHPLQAGNPDWRMHADIDAPAAGRTRHRIFAELADAGALVAGGHFPGPGIGRVRAGATRWAFVSDTVAQVNGEATWGS